jgi:hypothetical protein
MSITAVSATRHGAPAAERERHADHPVTGLDVDAAPDIFQCGRVVPGDPGHHGIGIAKRHHAGAEMVAVGVDQPLAIALQVAFALQPRIEIVGIGIDPAPGRRRREWPRSGADRTAPG